MEIDNTSDGQISLEMICLNDVILQYIYPRPPHFVLQSYQQQKLRADAESKFSTLVR